MKELSRVQLIAIENGYFWAQFQNMITGKTETRCYRTLNGFHCAMTKHHNKVSRWYNRLSQEEN